MTLNESSSIAVRGFGSTDLQVSEFGLGCARIGGIFKRDPAEFINLLSAAYDVGITFFDTANIYSQGESEELIGRAFRTRRERVVIATKAGFVLPARRQVVARLKPIVRPMLKALGISRQHLPSAVRGSVSQDFSGAGLRGAVEGSLRRLRTDRLDLLQLHAPALEVVEGGEWVDTLEALKRDGKIRYYGVSCESPDASLAALKHPGVSSIQVAINLLYREELAAIRSAAGKNVAVIGRESLANGLLVKDLPREQIRGYVESDEEAERKADAIEAWRGVAGRYGMPLAQLALSYVNGLDGIAVTLVGASRLMQLDAIAAAGLPTRIAAQSDRSPFNE